MSRTLCVRLFWRCLGVAALLLLVLLLISRDAVMKMPSCVERHQLRYGHRYFGLVVVIRRSWPPAVVVAVRWISSITSRVTRDSSHPQCLVTRRRQRVHRCRVRRELLSFRKCSRIAVGRRRHYDVIHCRRLAPHQQDVAYRICCSVRVLYVPGRYSAYGLAWNGTFWH